MDLQKARDWADFVLKTASIVGIVVAGVWAYYQYRSTDSGASNLQLSISTESQEYEKGFRLLVIHVKPKNAGKVPIEPDKDGFPVVVRTVPKNLKPGALDLDSLPVMFRTDLMKRFPDGYELEPGAQFDEIVALVVPQDATYAITATFNLNDGTEVDQTTVTHE